MCHQFEYQSMYGLFLGNLVGGSGFYHCTSHRTNRKTRQNTKSRSRRSWPSELMLQSAGPVLSWACWTRESFRPMFLNLSGTTDPRLNLADTTDPRLNLAGAADPRLNHSGTMDPRLNHSGTTYPGLNLAGAAEDYPKLPHTFFKHN
jgi:hypothetical protein